MSHDESGEHALQRPQSEASEGVAVAVATAVVPVPPAAASAVPALENGDALVRPESPPAQPKNNPKNPMEPLVIRRKLNGFVGFSNLPQQWHQHTIRRGFSLNVMVVGESGLGKSTLLETLIEAPLTQTETEAANPARPEDSVPVRVRPFTTQLRENDVKLDLTVIDTPGFGDSVNNLDSWKAIVSEIESRFDAYLEHETSSNRVRSQDERVHAVLYFIQPTGHSLKPLDIVVMKKLHKKVNLVPVIAKADTLTDAELEGFKQRILGDLVAQGIDMFVPPQFETDDQELVADTVELVKSLPLAVVGSTTLVDTLDGRQALGRSYPWGVVEVHNDDHCDFVKLRALLIRDHLEDLRSRTNELWEQYRTEKLLGMGIAQDNSVFRDLDPAARQEEERVLHEQRLAKMEAEMRAVFEQKVTEKEMKLKKSEAELFIKHKDIKEQLEQQRLELEARKERLEHQLAQAQVQTDKKGGRKGFSRR